MNLLIHPTYFPSISHYVAMAQSEKIVFEMEDNFQKQTKKGFSFLLISNFKFRVA